MLPRFRATSQMLEKTKPSTPLTSPWKPSSRVDLAIGADEGLEAGVGVSQLDRGAAAEQRQRQHARRVDHLGRRPDGVCGHGPTAGMLGLPALGDDAERLGDKLPALFDDLVRVHAGLLRPGADTSSASAERSRKP